MSWTKVLGANDLPVGARQVVKVGSQKILLLNHNGQLHAVANACPHLNLPLRKGKITEDGAIICPFHRSAFDLKSGEAKVWSPWPPVLGQALGKLSTESDLPVFPVRVEDGSIWVDVA